MKDIINNLKNLSIDNIDIDNIDSICDKLINVDIEYNERSELEYFLNIKMAGLSNIIKTDERYTRYIRRIDWKGCENIERHIKLFLNIESNELNLIKKLKLMRLIDMQLRQVIGG